MIYRTLAIVFAFFALQSTVNATNCTTGVQDTCPTGEECFSIHDKPGSTGVCGKVCVTGTQKGCPKGYTCRSHSPDVGGPGVCVADAGCTMEHIINAKTQRHIVNNIVGMYDNIFDSFSKALYVQVVNGEGGVVSCAGAESTACAHGQFCFTEPGNMEPTEGKCYKYAAGWGYCISGTNNPCGSGMKCVTPPKSMPGSVGRCIPSSSKPCKEGTEKPCATGFTCVAPPYTAVGTPGYCVKDDPCQEEKTWIQYVQFWQLSDQRSTYQWDMDKYHMELLKVEINKKAT